MISMKQRYQTVKEYDEKMKSMSNQVVSIYLNICHDPSIKKEKAILSLNAKVGSKATRYANIETKKFLSAEAYRDEWLHGALELNDHHMIELLKNNILREYIILFLERSFLKNEKKYRKIKLESTDRELYLGKNDCVIGVFIAPRKSNEIWHSYKLKGLSVRYKYLSLGQLVYEGYLKGKIQDDKYEAELIKVNDFEDIIRFYEIFIRNSSKNEKKFIENYLTYVKTKDEWMDIPMLLPELRWGGKDAFHKYRVDYFIANYFTGKRLAIELSPDSTHLIGKNIKNEWKKENDKRNSYQFDYKADTIIYTSEDLKDIENCFSRILYIFETSERKLKYEEIIKTIKMSTL